MTTQDSLSCEVFLVELVEDVPEAYTDEVQTREPVTGGIVHGKFKSHHRKHAAKATDQDQEMRRSQSVLSIKASGFPIIQNGSNNTLCHVQTCKCRNKSCLTSSDEGNDSVIKPLDIEEDSQGIQVDLILVQLSSVHSPMPVIPKRGCMNNSRYISLMTKLHDLQDNGTFEAHERIIQEELARRSPEDVDMKAILEIERAKAFYFQNNLKGTKTILKSVLKRELEMKNPGILTGRALNLLTAVYKRQRKFGNAMRCVEKAQKALELQDSHDDKGELCYTRGALLDSLPAPNSARDTRKTEAYKSYQRACQYSVNNNGYINTKMADLLLKPCFEVANNDTDICKEDVMKAKRHLDLTESRTADGNMGLGTRIKYLLLRSDQHYFEQNIAMAVEKAEEAMGLILAHRFELELDSAEKRIRRLSDMQGLEKGEWLSSESCSSSEDQTDRKGDSSSLE